MLRKLRDSVSIFAVHMTRQCGGSSCVGNSDHIRTVEDEREWNARDGGVLFGGEEDDEYRFSCRTII